MKLGMNIMPVEVIFVLHNFPPLLILTWAARDREVIYNLFYPIPNLTYSWCSLFIQTRLWGPNHGGITVPSFVEEML
jgi:hypothetical protein